MKSKDAQLKEKEKSEKLKALRKELETELEEQLAGQQLTANEKMDVQKYDSQEPLDEQKAKETVEALLFAASKPLTINEIKKVIKGYTPKQIENWINELKETFSSAGRSFEILEIAGGYEIATRKEFAPWVMKIELQKKARQATQSALETLSILAYKQPITRAEIEALRGVDVSGVLNTLMDRGLIKIVGKKEIAGRPFVYGTTEKFLEHFGLNSLADLPNISEIQNIVTSSVKKEELLGKSQIVPNSSENMESAEESPAESIEASQEEAAEVNQTEEQSNVEVKEEGNTP